MVSIVFITVKDAIQIICEYLKDEPWLTLLCKKLQLDINEIIGMSKTSEASFCAESSITFHPSDGKVGNGRAKSSKGRPAKKQKAEVESKNIKDMFRRVTKKGT
ncbi:hypothetical protein GUJ93_ZPchr0004g38850 [Zizania palustris]|uniref:Uncharacterized protein n=1 Tax=Zizania palustris TaxID=103762 RepID=A0A8J5SIT5_ZIZPA|nr:hypothetical protein GUJ93_ZPchr0004g38850 [Zizania palustris]